MRQQTISKPLNLYAKKKLLRQQTISKPLNLYAKKTFAPAKHL
jgi:hypothetical protein